MKKNISMRYVESKKTKGELSCALLAIVLSRVSGLAWALLASVITRNRTLESKWAHTGITRNGLEIKWVHTGITRNHTLESKAIV